MNKNILFLFFAVLLLGIILRFYNLSQVPPGVNRDEASIGYTAYSLIMTGKDEYGRIFPLSFQSFGDWKLPFYTYITIPFVYFFGLGELAVRFPSALFGAATVGLTFFLVKEFFKNNFLAILAMLLVAIAPWHLHLSRVESESNTAVFFITCGVILFFKYLKSKNWLIIPSLLFFSLTYFTYAGNYVFTTLLILTIAFIYRKQIPKTKYLFAGITLFLVLTIFISFQTMFANKTKISGIGIFGDPSVVYAQIEIPRNQSKDPQSLGARIIHNRVVFGAERFLQNYLNSYSPDFLFIKGGGNSAHNIKNFGNMYIVEAPFLVLGLVYLLFFKKGKERSFVLFWFFISALAPSITKDAPHTNRMFAIFPILPLVTATGLWWILSKIKLLKQKSIIAGIITILFIVNFGIYLDRYYVYFPRDEAQNWGLGYKELSDLLVKPQLLGKKVIMSNPEQSPYIYLLFYQRYDPSSYQKTAVIYPPTEDGFYHVKSFGRYEFRPVNWEKDINVQNTIVVDKLNHPSTDSINLPNGQKMFSVEIK